MFCTRCGAQNSDTSSFCEQCGSPLTKPIPVQSVEQAQSAQAAQPIYQQPPMQPTQSEIPSVAPINLQKPGQDAQPVMQPTQPTYQQPVQPTYQQPMQQPMGGMQPAYAAPVYTQPVAPKKPKTVPIVLASISAVLAVFLILLFTVIIPNSGVRGKLRHKWTVSGGGSAVTYDFKKNTVTSLGFDVPMKWSVKGDDHLTIEMTLLGLSEKTEYIFSLSDDGKTLTLKNADYPSSKLVLNRVG